MGVEWGSDVVVLAAVCGPPGMVPQLVNAVTDASSPASVIAGPMRKTVLFLFMTFVLKLILLPEIIAGSHGNAILVFKTTAMSRAV